MRALLLCFALLLAMAYLGCTKEADGINPLEEDSAPVVQVTIAENVLTVGKSAHIEVSFQVRNGCGGFGSFSTATNGNLTIVKVIPQYAAGFCTQTIETRQATFTFTPQRPSTYTLKFWTGEDDYITEVVTVM